VEGDWWEIRTCNAGQMNIIRVREIYIKFTVNASSPNPFVFLPLPIAKDTHEHAPGPCATLWRC